MPEEDWSEDIEPEPVRLRTWVDVGELARQFRRRTFSGQHLGRGRPGV